MEKCNTDDKKLKAIQSMVDFIVAVQQKWKQGYLYPDYELFQPTTMPYRCKLTNGDFDQYLGSLQGLPIDDMIAKLLIGVVDATNRLNILKVLEFIANDPNAPDENSRSETLLGLLANDPSYWEIFDDGFADSDSEQNDVSANDLKNSLLNMPSPLDSQKGLFMNGTGVQTDSPLILDLDGDGVETLSHWRGVELEKSGTHY